MTEREVILLGFSRNDVTEDQHWEPYHYYSYRVTKGMEFISSASDGVKDGEWYVDVFNTEETIRFYVFEEVQSLINMLNRHKVTEESSK